MRSTRFSKPLWRSVFKRSFELGVSNWWSEQVHSTRGPKLATGIARGGKDRRWEISVGTVYRRNGRPCASQRQPRLESFGPYLAKFRPALPVNHLTLAVHHPHLHHLPNCFSMSMPLAPPAEAYYEEHTSLDLLNKQINEHIKRIQLPKSVSGSSSLPSSFAMHWKEHSFRLLLVRR